MTHGSELVVQNDLAPWETYTVDLEWTWNTGISSFLINVTVDSDDVIDEFDEGDNSYLITWERRSKFVFVQLPHVTDTDIDSVKIEWSTSIPGTAIVEYGMDRELSDTYSPPGTSDQVSEILDQLLPGTQYLYRVKVIDEYGRTIISDVEPFVTLPPENGDDPIIDFSGDLEYRMGGGDGDTPKHR